MKKEILYRFIDYIVLNAYSVNSLGLLNGKAGLALTLFEAARFLNDESLQKLILESLILMENRSDYSFESGWAGIGFTLLYLLNNDFLEGDFDELFEDRWRQMIGQLNRLESFSANHLSLIHFLFAANKIKKEEQVTSLIDRILLDNAEKLKVYLLGFNDVTSKMIKQEVKRFFLHYLKMIVEIGAYSSFHPVFDSYINVFNKGKIGSDFTIGFYLEQIGKRLGDQTMTVVAGRNKALLNN